MLQNCSHLFGLRPVKGFITLYDVRDAYDLAKRYPHKRHRDEIYASFGLDGDRVEEYYPKVVHLNNIYVNSYEKEQNEKERTSNTKISNCSVRFNIGKLKFTIEHDV